MTKTFYVHSLKAFHEIFLPNFKIQVPAVKQNTISSKYACPMRGEDFSPEIKITGIPKSNSHKDIRLHIVLQDSTCTWGCNTQGKFDHWVADFPVSAMGKKSNSELFTKDSIKLNAAHNKKFIESYAQPNSLGMKYLGPCPPVGQPHAFIVLGLAYYYDANHQVKIIGKTQSVPFIYGDPNK